MTSSPACITPGAFVTLHYRLSGPSGAVVDTFAHTPATLTLGSGALAPALEERLIGLAEGDERSFDWPAGAVFGQRSAQMLQWLGPKDLKALGEFEATYAVGDVLQVATPDGQGQVGAVVRALRQTADGQALQLDFNHPLAGVPVRLDVRVIGVL